MQDKLTDPRIIQQTLKQHQFQFSKQNGQNFLINANIPEQMAQLFKGRTVLEIGPGFGGLTQSLCRKAEFVIAVETDRRLIPILQNNLKDCENLKLIQGDALELDLNSLFIDKYSVCANLPYSITAPILTKLLQNTTADTIVVMVQKEVAERICAKPATKQYGAFTIFCRMYADCEILFFVEPDNFIPQPKVQSAVIQFTRHNNPIVPEHCVKTTKRLVKAAFAQRRKTLINALSAGLAMSKQELEQKLTKSGIDCQLRGEALTLEDYIRIAENIISEE